MRWRPLSFLQGSDMPIKEGMSSRFVFIPWDLTMLQAIYKNPYLHSPEKDSFPHWIAVLHSSMPFHKILSKIKNTSLLFSYSGRYLLKSAFDSFWFRLFFQFTILFKTTSGFCTFTANFKNRRMYFAYESSMISKSSNGRPIAFDFLNVIGKNMVFSIKAIALHLHWVHHLSFLINHAHLFSKNEKTCIDCW